MILWIKLIGRSLCLGPCWTATYFLSVSGQKRKVLLMCLLLVAWGIIACPPRAGPLKPRDPKAMYRLFLNPPLYTTGSKELKQFTSNMMSVPLENKTVIVLWAFRHGLHCLLGSDNTVITRLVWLFHWQNVTKNNNDLWSEFCGQGCGN
jgi:hypothetical protein